VEEPLAKHERQAGVGEVEENLKQTKPVEDKKNPFTGRSEVPQKVAPAAKDDEEEELLDDGTGVVKPQRRTSGRSTNPFASDKKGTPKPAAAEPKAKPKPAFERGKRFDLFPKDRQSTIGEHVSPAQDVGQKSSGLKESKYHGWSWASRHLTGFSVKDGILHQAKPGSLTLDSFSATEFDLSFEVRLSRNSALGLKYGTAKGHINLVLVTPKGVFSGTYKASEAKNNIQASKKDAKPFPVRTPWIPLKISGCRRCSFRMAAVWLIRSYQL